MFPDLDITQVWLLSNGVGAVAFFALTAFIMLGVRSHHAASRLLLAACAMTGCWFAFLTAAPLVSISGPLLDVVETARTGLWLVTAAWVVPAGRMSMRHRWLRGIAVALPVSIVGYLLWRLADPSGMIATGHSVLFTVGAMVMSLYGLVLVEQTYRASNLDARWAVKYLCLALATLFAYDFMMYSGALAAHHIALSVWNARGAVNALVAPLIGMAAARNAKWSARVSVSNQVIFRTGALIVAGAYLMVVAGGSTYIRRFDSSWAEVTALLFTVTATLLLVVFFLSGQVRGHARVLLHKHLLQYRYDYREQWLALTRRLSRDDGDLDVYERAIRAIAQPVDSPAGALWLARDGRFTCVAEWNMAAAADVSEPLTGALAVYLGATAWVVDRAEFERDPAKYDGFEPPSWFMTLERARLMIPLFAGQQRLVGFLVLAEPRASFELNWEEIDLLKAFAQQIGVYLDYQEANRALTQARQFEAFNRLTAFLMHDLKNIAGQQSLMLENAERHKHNPAFVDDMIATIEHSVTRMRGVLNQLQKVSRSENRTERVDVDAAIDQLIDELAGTSPAPVRRGPASGAVVNADRDRLIMVLRHLVRNAQDATGEHGQVEIETRFRDGGIEIAVSDDGEGMTAAFIRDSLFQPFVSTKSTRGMGIGAYQVRDFARASGGDVFVVSTPGRGTRFAMVLPVVADASAEPAFVEGRT
ncbi:XrtA/PEP-CTERM system histidine kinase PrsK [Salinisphaera sp. LB1]|uniref:XrtA/PEP-CTERM system histidine kinase PrsK n=1 Tax=Salinisphaera sp. LB1 TaxID=2183911 RepID=UPI000D7052EF|nr:XrtA/PEP-CTERM system histidine kinase PrsK [Salinisphaera sp. LB1]AWN14313.1 Sensory transduction histidine kinase [Salinisphaera sp. LB1]